MVNVLRIDIAKIESYFIYIHQFLFVSFDCRFVLLEITILPGKVPRVSLCLHLTLLDEEI